MVDGQCVAQPILPNRRPIVQMSVWEGAGRNLAMAIVKKRYEKSHSYDQTRSTFPRDVKWSSQDLVAVCRYEWLWCPVLVLDRLVIGETVHDVQASTNSSK